MPSSRTLAVALTAVVLFAGCSALPGGGADTTTTRDAPDYHEFVFAGDTGGKAYEATITVRTDGQTVLEESVASDGNGTFLELGRLNGSGPYTVTVNTTIPAAGGGNMSETFTVDGGGGNATAVRASFVGISHSTFRLPRTSVEGAVVVAAETEQAAGRVRVRYRGERIASTEYAVNDSGGDVDETIAALADSGVYRVAVHTGGEWTNETLVVRPDEQVVVRYSVSGYLKGIQVESADNP